LAWRNGGFSRGGIWLRAIPAGLRSIRNLKSIPLTGIGHLVGFSNIVVCGKNFCRKCGLALKPSASLADEG
jgi:hypothetical protein